MPTPDYIVDINGLAPRTNPPANNLRSPRVGRPWLAVHWRCCGTYSRIYRNPTGDAYEGRCPRCGRPVRARVGAGGTSARFFEAG